MDALVAVPLPDGRWIALTSTELEQALAKGQELGLSVPGPGLSQSPPVATINSRELAVILGVSSTTCEAMAQRGDIPFVRVGKALRFIAGDVLAKLKEKSGEPAAR